MRLNGIVLDVDTVYEGSRSVIRLSVKTRQGFTALYDYSFMPYLYLLPRNESLKAETIAGIKVPIGNSGSYAAAERIEKKQMSLFGKQVSVFKIYAADAKNIPLLKEYFEEFGSCYEYDIPFWKRYLIDNDISPLYGISADVHEEAGKLVIDKVESSGEAGIALSHLCFDIETYNPNTTPRMGIDPIIMVSFANERLMRMISAKRIDKDFAVKAKDEKDMLELFAKEIREGDYDIIAGYNSSNFDIPYILKRAEKLKANFSISRFENEKVYEMHHGLLNLVKIPGRINIDIYNTAKFVAVVGTAEYLIKVNRFTLGEVYRALTGKAKKTVNKPGIYRMYDSDGAELDELAAYSLDDSVSLEELYQFFMPLEMEISKLAGTTLSETAVSTTGQLVEYLLMRYAHKSNQLIPNKPEGGEISDRLSNPFEGAYVKTPSAGIYNNLAVLDFRGLYPSIIIAHNIDPSTVLEDQDSSTEYYESPTGVRFRKSPKGIIPTLLDILIKEREGAKKAYKQNPENKSLGARSQALKIIANSFYGYLGYARSRWYSRACGASVTAYGREYIKDTIEKSESAGFHVLYSDTDSVVLLLGSKTKQDVLEFLKKVNSSLPKSMELELEDFYVRGVFVGKKGEGEIGAKKKYALLSESGRIKIRGFELVRRDWSNVARETQKRVLEEILKEGSKERAVAIVKEVIKKLQTGTVELKDLVIYTQLRKGINSYDATSPELEAARKAIRRGKQLEDIENATVGYVITKHGSSISDKAELEEYAQDYDADYYINHQVIPATLKILKELGVSEEELKGEGVQRRLGA
ncbi:MAG: DNA-directed DNA polymerase [Candidatus Micrarchaeaceae archaeon]